MTQSWIPRALLLLVLVVPPAHAAPSARAARVADPHLASGFRMPSARHGEVTAVATGQVAAIFHDEGTVVVIAHHWLDDHHVRVAWSVYGPLVDAGLVEGDWLPGGGTLGHLVEGRELRFSLQRHEPDAEHLWVSDVDHLRRFVTRWASTPVPALADDLLVVDKTARRMEHFEHGRYRRGYEVALSQSPVGHKQRRGDNRLPEGLYRITEKSRGPFTGPAGPYFGVGWMRLSYPNRFDADGGLERGLISPAQHAAIIAADRAGVTPPRTTALGSGIGIHGWYGRWDPSRSRALTWGCVSMQNVDLDRLYDEVEVGTIVVILP